MNVESPPIDAIIPFGRSGLVYIKWYQRPCCPLGILLFSPLDCSYFCITYSPQKAKKICIVTYSLSYSLIVPCKFISDLRCWVCALGQVLVAGFRSFLVQFVFSPLFFIIIREHLQVLLSFLCIHQTLVHAILFVTLVFTVFIKSLLSWPILRTLFLFCPLIRSLFLKLV